MHFPFLHVVESPGTELGSRGVGAGLVVIVLLLVPGSAVGEAISVVGFDDAAGVGEHGEPLIERGGADATAGTQLGEWQRGVSTSECGGDALVERAWWRRCSSRR
jgi:hypothetical protein